jgi:DNA gyrase/topoisomerase IV subunit B
MIAKQKTKAPAAKKPSAYTAANIKTLVFPDSVRENASQYIGGTDSYGLWLVVKELLDNGLDEALAGRNNAVLLHVDKDGSFWIQDAGHGVPQGITKTKIHVNGKDIINKMSTMQSVFGALHTSGKYDTKAYEVSIGTHGIGSKGTNATAEYFDVWTYFEDQWYTIGFKKGQVVRPVAKCRAPKGPNGALAKSGTLIHFKPDMTIFSTDKFPGQMAVEWAEIMSYFNPGVAIIISTPKGKKQFLSKVGVLEYIQKRLEKFGVGAERVMFEYKSEHGDPNAADIVVAFSGHTDCDLRGFTNGSSNNKGGKHVDSVIAVLYEGIRPFIKTRKIRAAGKSKDMPMFSAADLKEGMVGVVNAKLHKAKFNSQDKVFLSDERMGLDFRKKLLPVALKFFRDNKAMAQRICEKASRIAELKTKFVMSKAAASKLNAVKRNGLPSKYAVFDSRSKVADRELFLVEGDSAGGPCKEARFPYQAILPLKGKIMNALKPTKKKNPLESDEIINILAALGFDLKASDPYTKLNVGKIICLADPDPDGPFVGDTKIRFRLLEGSEEIGSIESMVSLRAFEVPVWHGSREIWAPATASLVKNVDELVALEIGKTKVCVDRSHRFQCLFTKAMRGRDVDEVHDNEKLVWVRAENLKVGDRVYHPMSNNSRDPATMDKESRLGFQALSKMRIQRLSEPIPVYCLTVPKYHSFIMPSGIVSANCHINSLLLSLIYAHLPKLFDNGQVYVADAPEFYSQYKGSLITGMGISQVRAKLKKLKAPTSVVINHVKGYGELDSEIIRIFAMDPATRRLIKIGPIEAEDKIEFVKLMNEDVQYRREVFGLPKNATGGEEDGTVKVRRVAAKRPAVKKVRGSGKPVTDQDVEHGQMKLARVRKQVRAQLAATAADPKKGKSQISRLGPLSDAISEVAARKRVFKPTGKTTRRNVTA